MSRSWWPALAVALAVPAAAGAEGPNPFASRVAFGADAGLAWADAEGEPWVALRATRFGSNGLGGEFALSGTSAPVLMGDLDAVYGLRLSDRSALLLKGGASALAIPVSDGYGPVLLGGNAGAGLLVKASDTISLRADYTMRVFKGAVVHSATAGIVVWGR